MQYVTVCRVSCTVMFHGFPECVDVVSASWKITHELFSIFLGILNGIKDCATKVDDKDLVVDEVVLLDLFPYGVRNIHDFNCSLVALLK